MTSKFLRGSLYGVGLLALGIFVATNTNLFSHADVANPVCPDAKAKKICLVVTAAGPDGKPAHSGSSITVHLTGEETQSITNTTNSNGVALFTFSFKKNTGSYSPTYDFTPSQYDAFLPVTNKALTILNPTSTPPTLSPKNNYRASIALTSYSNTTGTGDTGGGTGQTSAPSCIASANTADACVSIKVTDSNTGKAIKGSMVTVPGYFQGQTHDGTNGTTLGLTDAFPVRLQTKTNSNHTKSYVPVTLTINATYTIAEGQTRTKVAQILIPLAEASNSVSNSTTVTVSGITNYTVPLTLTIPSGTTGGGTATCTVNSTTSLLQKLIGASTAHAADPTGFICMDVTDQKGNTLGDVPVDINKKAAGQSAYVYEKTVASSTNVNTFGTLITQGLRVTDNAYYPDHAEFQVIAKAGKYTTDNKDSEYCQSVTKVIELTKDTQGNYRDASINNTIQMTCSPQMLGSFTCPPDQSSRDATGEVGHQLCIRVKDWNTGNSLVGVPVTIYSITSLSPYKDDPITSATTDSQGLARFDNFNVRNNEGYGTQTILLNYSIPDGTYTDSAGNIKTCIGLADVQRGPLIMQWRPSYPGYWDLNTETITLSQCDSTKVTPTPQH